MRVMGTRFSTRSLVGVSMAGMPGFEGAAAACFATLVATTLSTSSLIIRPPLPEPLIEVGSSLCSPAVVERPDPLTLLCRQRQLDHRTQVLPKIERLVTSPGSKVASNASLAIVAPSLTSICYQDAIFRRNHFHDHFVRLNFHQQFIALNAISCRFMPGNHLAISNRFREGWSFNVYRHDYLSFLPLA